MRFKEILTAILILMAILSVYFVTAAATPAYVHIKSVVDTPNGLFIEANITSDPDGTTLLPSGYGIQAKFTSVSCIGQPSTAGSNYTTTGNVSFIVENCHTYNYNSITVSFDDYYPGNYTPVPATWINHMCDGPNINGTPIIDNESVVIRWEVGTPLFVNNSDNGTDTTVNVTVTNNDTGENTTVIGNITFDGNETTNDTTKINTDGVRNGTTVITDLPSGNYTGKVVVTGNANDDRKGSASGKFSFEVGGSKGDAGVPLGNAGLPSTGLPIYGLMVMLLSVLLFFQNRIRR